MSCGAVHSQAREMVSECYTATLVAATLAVSRSSLYYRKKPRGSRADRQYDEQIVVACGEKTRVWISPRDLVAAKKRKPPGEPQTCPAGDARPFRMAAFTSIFAAWKMSLAEAHGSALISTRNALLCNTPSSRPQSPIGCWKRESPMAFLPPTFCSRWSATRKARIFD